LAGLSFATRFPWLTWTASDLRTPKDGGLSSMSEIYVYNERPSAITLPSLKVRGRVMPAVVFAPGPNAVDEMAWSEITKSRGFRFVSQWLRISRADEPIPDEPFGRPRVRQSSELVYDPKQNVSMPKVGDEGVEKPVNPAELRPDDLVVEAPPPAKPIVVDMKPESVSLLDYVAADAKVLIAQEARPAVISGWLSQEERKTVIRALKKRLKELGED
jgi:hypothetical protein